MDLYRQQIIDQYKNPRNFGKIKDKSKSTHGENPSCGDSIKIDAVIKGDKIEDIKFSGEGCAISIASASMLTEKVKGMKITEIADLDFDYIQDMLEIEVSPARKRCAMLALTVLKRLILMELNS